MTDVSKPQSGGINIDADSVAAQGDIVGRDKIIHNIVIVGQLLDYTRVEGLIPKVSGSSDFESITAAYETVFGGTGGNDFAKAAAFAGEVLGEALADWRKKQAVSPVLVRDLLPDMARYIVKNLKRLGYWEIFCEELRQKNEVIWLSSLQELWHKRYKPKTELKFGIAEGQYTPLDGDKKTITQQYFLWMREGIDTGVRFKKMGHEESYTFLAGVVIDLCRLASIASIDAKVLNGLIEFLASGKR